MIRTTITPQLLQDFLEVHAIGADAPGGAGLIEDRSIDRDNSEVSINGTYDLSAVANELNTIDQTGTTAGWAFGMRRLLIVWSVVWFTPWLIYIGLRAYFDDYAYPYQSELTANLLCAVGLPILSVITFYAIRWIWRGFKGSRRA